MSDFVTRLVERQAGAVAMVQPRTPSKFAPTGIWAEPSDFSVVDSLLPRADVNRTPPASIRQGNHEGDLLTQTDQEERRPPAFEPQPTLRAMPKLPQAEPSPVPLLKSASAVAPQLTPETLTSPQVRSVTIRNQAPSRRMETTQQNIVGHLGSSPLPPTARIEPPPTLVKTRQDMPRSSPVAPSSLALGAGMSRRTQHISAAPNEPPVEVTIGRIEVTAVSAAPDQKRKPSAGRPAMSLEEYLARRQRERA